MKKLFASSIFFPLVYIFGNNFYYPDLEKLLPYDSHGWYSNAGDMEQLIKEVKPKTVIELGSWLGSSTSHIASLLPVNGKLYAVDHWLGSAEHIGRKDVEKKLPFLYEQFLSNMIHKKVENKVIPVRNYSEIAVSFFIENNIVPDLIYVDASHDEANVYKDISLYFPLVKGHGVMCGDDWAWGQLGVQKAVKRYAEENNLDVVVKRNWFWILKEKTETTKKKIIE